MKWIVYCTTCTVNNKIYIGYHKTENPDIFDGYIGDGIYNSNHYYIHHPKTVFHKAVKKYGYNKFIRKILKIFDNAHDALDLEAQLVTIDFIKRNDVYNTAVGGICGGTRFSHPRQYSLTGELIKEWHNVDEISNELKINKTSINDAMSRKVPIKGFYFISKGDIYEIIKSNELNSPKKDKCISAYDPATKQLICTYSGIKEIRIKFKCDYRDIHDAMEKQEVFKGALWCYGYAEQYNSEKLTFKPRKVLQFDLDGHLIRTWNTVAECAKTHPKCREVLKGHRNHTHGFVFKFDE